MCVSDFLSPWEQTATTWKVRARTTYTLSCTSASSVPLCTGTSSIAVFFASIILKNASEISPIYVVCVHLFN